MMELPGMCDAGQIEIIRQADTEDIRVLLRTPEAVAALRARLCEAVTADPESSVAITVLGDSYQEGQWNAAPLPGVTVYAGDWRANQALGITDEQGRLRFTIEPGQRSFSVFKLTSSHSALWSDPVALQVSTQHPNALSIHVAPVTVRIRSSLSIAYGCALYITGAGRALGDWHTATRFTPEADGHWELLKNIPIGAPYKIIEAPWSELPEIPVTDAVSWEWGPNHVIPPLDGSYEVVIDAEPRFEESNAPGTCRKIMLPSGS